DRKRNLAEAMMRKSLLALLLILSSFPAAFADNCPAATYDKYLGKGFSCGIASDTFTNFAYTGTSNPPGFGIQAGAINVKPITTPGDPGFQFSAAWAVSSAGQAQSL